MESHHWKVNSDRVRLCTRKRRAENLSTRDVTLEGLMVQGDSLRHLLPQLVGHGDDVRVPHAAGDVVPGVVEEEDEAHLIDGAGTTLEKKRRQMEKETKAGRGNKAGGSGGGVTPPMTVLSFPLNLQPAH